MLTLVAALTIVLATQCATAAAQPTVGVLFQYLVGDLPANQQVSISFTSEVEGRSAKATTIAGSIGTVVFGPASFSVTSAGPDPLPGTFRQGMVADGQTVTGIATVPKGAAVALTNLLTGDRIFLRGGAFSIPTRASPPKVNNITCEGNNTSCKATLAVPVGTHNRKLVIKLSHPNLQLESIAATPGSTFGKHVLGQGHLSDNGAEYVILLKQYLGQTRSSQLVFKFGRATAGKATKAR